MRANRCMVSSSRRSGLAGPGPEPGLPCRSGPGRAAGVRSILIGADDLTDVLGAQGAIGLDVDGVLHEPDRTVAHEEIAATGVEAPEAVLPQVHALRDRDPAEGIAEGVLGGAERVI